MKLAKKLVFLSAAICFGMAVQPALANIALRFVAAQEQAPAVVLVRAQRSQGGGLQLEIVRTVVGDMKAIHLVGDIRSGSRAASCTMDTSILSCSRLKVNRFAIS